MGQYSTKVISSPGFLCRITDQLTKNTDCIQYIAVVFNVFVCSGYEPIASRLFLTGLLWFGGLDM